MADIIVDTSVLDRAPQELREIILSKYADTIKNNIRAMAKNSTLPFAPEIGEAHKPKGARP